MVVFIDWPDLFMVFIIGYIPSEYCSVLGCFSESVFVLGWYFSLFWYLHLWKKCLFMYPIHAYNALEIEGRKKEVFKNDLNGSPISSFDISLGSTVYLCLMRYKVVVLNAKIGFDQNYWKINNLTNVYISICECYSSCNHSWQWVIRFTSSKSKFCYSPEG